MSRFDDLDDLDELEREVGPSVRVALRRAAASVADDASAHVLGRADAEVPVVYLEPAPEARRGPRRWQFAAAAVAALLLIVGSALVWVATNDDVDAPAPAGPAPTATTVAPTPLVASVAFWGPNNQSAAPGWGDTSLNLFADGRLIKLPSRGVSGDIGEQRLTPEGVERVRSEILATVFGGDQQSADPFWASCRCTIRVRDGGRLLSTRDLGAPPSSAVDPRVDPLIKFLTTLESSLPASAWEQQDVTAFVPLRYRVCVYRETPTNNAQPISDIPDVLARRLPARVARLLASANPCLELPTRDARTLARRLIDAGMKSDSWSPRVHYTTPLPGAVLRSVAIDLAPLLPDGEPASWD